MVLRPDRSVLQDVSLSEILIKGNFPENDRTEDGN